MPLYIKSPIPSLCNINIASSLQNIIITPSTLLDIQEEQVYLTPLPRFRTIHSSDKKIITQAQKPPWNRNFGNITSNSKIKTTTSTSTEESQNYARSPPPIPLVIKSRCQPNPNPNPKELIVTVNEQNVEFIPPCQLSSCHSDSQGQGQGHNKMNIPDLGLKQALTKSKASPSNLFLFANKNKELLPRINNNLPPKILSREQRNLRCTSMQALQKTKVSENDTHFDFPDHTKSVQKFPETISTSSPILQIHSTNPFAEAMNKEALQEAVTLLQASTKLLLQKMDLHPETLRQIRQWSESYQQQQRNNPNVTSVAKELVTPLLDGRNLYKNSQLPLSTQFDNNRNEVEVNVIKRVQSVMSSYFPNSNIPSKRAYKYKNSDTNLILPIGTSSTPKFLLGIRDSISNISLVPMVSSTCPSIPSSIEQDLSLHYDISESELSDIEDEPFRRIKSKKIKKKLPQKSSVPLLRTQMKKIIRTLSGMNAIPEVVDILIKNLPTASKDIKSNNRQSSTTENLVSSTVKMTMPNPVSKDQVMMNPLKKSAVIEVISNENLSNSEELIQLYDSKNNPVDTRLDPSTSILKTLSSDQEIISELKSRVSRSFTKENEPVVVGTGTIRIENNNGEYNRVQRRKSSITKIKKTDSKNLAMVTIGRSNTRINEKILPDLTLSEENLTTMDQQLQLKKRWSKCKTLKKKSKNKI